MYKALLVLFVATSLTLLLFSDAPEMISRIAVIALIFVVITLIFSMLFATIAIKLLATFAVASIIVATVLSPAFRETMLQLWHYSNAVLVDLGQDVVQSATDILDKDTQQESYIHIKPSQ